MSPSLADSRLPLPSSHTHLHPFILLQSPFLHTALSDISQHPSLLPCAIQRMPAPTCCLTALMPTISTTLCSHLPLYCYSLYANPYLSSFLSLAPLSAISSPYSSETSPRPPLMGMEYTLCPFSQRLSPPPPPPFSSHRLSQVPPPHPLPSIPFLPALCHPSCLFAFTF